MRDSSYLARRPVVKGKSRRVLLYNKSSWWGPEVREIVPAKPRSFGTPKSLIRSHGLPSRNPLDIGGRGQELISVSPG